MADAALTLQLSKALSTRLQAAASEAHRGVQEFAESILEEGLAVQGDKEDWAEDERRWAEFERSGESYPLEDVLQAFHEGLEVRLSTTR